VVPRSLARGFARLATLALVPLAPALAGAQGAERLLEGRVVLPGAAGAAGAVRPVRDAWVVLHRVASDTAGPLDSMRTRADGGYRFRYRPTGDTAAIYFVSTNRGGIAYFTPPAREAVVRGDAGELLVYDTTSAPIPITIRGRHVIVTAPDTGDTRAVIEVYEVSNDTTLTRVARGAQGITFDAPLPPGATRLASGDGDVSPDAIRMNAGRAEVAAPLAPGVKRVSFYYDLPTDRSTIDLLVESAVPVLEVLIEDPNGSVEGAGLVAVDPVTVEGRPFRRYLAQDVAAAQTFRITAPTSGPGNNLRLMLIVTAIGTAMLFGLGAAFLRRGPSAFVRQRAVDPESLALEIAALDARFDAIASPSEQQRAEHYLARAHLKGRLSDALAKRDGLA
jgi:hypothetical protein